MFFKTGMSLLGNGYIKPRKKRLDILPFRGWQYFEKTLGGGWIYDPEVDGYGLLQKFILGCTKHPEKIGPMITAFL